eukprot:6963286-Ditylum_brightwellii.AAC.1
MPVKKVVSLDKRALLTRKKAPSPKKEKHYFQNGSLMGDDELDFDSNLEEFYTWQGSSINSTVPGDQNC